MNKNMLLSKINAQMLIQCESGITDELVAELQNFKSSADKFDSSKASDLVKVDFHQFDSEDKEDGNSISFSNVENAMLN